MHLGEFDLLRDSHRLACHMVTQHCVVMLCNSNLSWQARNSAPQNPFQMQMTPVGRTVALVYDAIHSWKLVGITMTLRDGHSTHARAHMCSHGDSSGRPCAGKGTLPLRSPVLQGQGVCDKQGDPRALVR